MRPLTHQAAAAFAVAATLVAASAATAASGRAPVDGQAARGVLVDLDNLAALKGAFNKARGEIRIVLLLSPT